MIWTGILIMLLTFFLMEGVTWCTHKFVMHGFLWYLHADHHDKDHDHSMERNDAFFLVFAIPSFFLFYFGATLGLHLPYFWIGAGIAMYGAAYVMVHDIFIHQRIKWFKRAKNPYFVALRKAHKVHHKHRGKEDGECFGMLFVPLKYFKQAWRSRRKMKDLAKS